MSLRKKFITAWLWIFLFSCTGNTKNTAALNNNKLTEVLSENKKSVQMKVEGMTCAMGCAKFIEDKVAEMNGVFSSKVNFEEGTAFFDYDKSVLSAQEIETFIGEIHKGQYSAKILDVKSGESEKTLIEKPKKLSKKNISEVSQNLNISLPELFTYFVKSLR